jgi:hypothetical protein
MAELSDHVVMAVDSQKLSAGAAARCLHWESVDLMVTELDLADTRLDRIATMSSSSVPDARDSPTRAALLSLTRRQRESNMDYG